MRRDEHSQIESAGQDSFLDVTTNIVGILIVLVMVVGMRARNPIVAASGGASAGDKAPTMDELESLSKNAAAIEYEANRISEETEAVDREISGRSAEREELATMIAAAEKQIADERAKLGSANQEDFDLRRLVNESHAIVDRGEAELDETKNEKPPVQEVKHYPTPISRTVIGHEVHFQLSGGRVTYVPIDDFIDDVRSNLRGSAGDLANITDKVGVVGPRNGFEFRYTMDVVTDRGRGVVGIRTREFQVVPVGMQQGETIQKALGRQSEFRTALAPHSPRDTTVTLWVYPDSFDVYRQLKEELHNMGYATAGRPLPVGVLIGGSDHGTKSSAQ